MNTTPFWDPKVARATFTVAAVATTLAGIYVVRRTLFILVLAVFFAYMVYPLVRVLERLRPQRAPRILSPIAAFLLLIALLVLIGALIGPSLVEQATTLGDRLPTLLRQSGAIETWPWPGFLEPYAVRIGAFVRTQLDSGVAAALPFAQRIGVGLLQLAGNLLFVVLIPVLAFLLMISAPRIHQRLRALVVESRRSTWENILDDLHHLVGGYIRALFLLSLSAFTAYAVFLSATGAPYALLLAAAAGILEFIPVFGPLISAVLVLGVAGVSQYSHLLWLVIFVVCYRIFQDYVLGPKLMGTGAGVHPILVIIGLLAGEQIGGLAGIFLAVPVMAAGMVIARHLMRPLLGRQP